MSGHTTQSTASGLWHAEDDGAPQMGWALVLVWSLEAPERVGEVGWMPARGALRVAGREVDRAGDDTPLTFVRQRPGRNLPSGGLPGQRISRRQLEVEPRESGVTVRNVGRCKMLVDGRVTESAVLSEGGMLQLKDQAVLMCTRRPSVLPSGRAFDMRSAGDFGRPDEFGLVGESVSAWELRERLAFLGPREGHVLVTGASGVGKELAARALHSASPRSPRELVARNAATIPDGLIDAELFGNIRDYPNPGMRERPGLVGAADGSTLFLDELGELPEALQAHLLRVLDGDGEYQRLGESATRVSNIRLVAATNRPVEALKHDIAARLALRLHLPGLNERREDVPLLTAHLLRDIAAQDRAIGERFFERWGTAAAHPRVAPDLMERLIRHDYTLHVRELQAALWRSMATSTGSVLQLTEDVASVLPRGKPFTAPSDVSSEAIAAALARHDGNRTRAAKDLGLKNRDVLYRLMRKHGLS